MSDYSLQVSHWWYFYLAILNSTLQKINGIPVIPVVGGNFAPQVIWYFIMISTHRIITSILIMFASINVICGQVVSHTNNTIDADSLRMEFDKAPYFGLYKDNYFIFGPPLNHKPNRENTNVKFQFNKN